MLCQGYGVWIWCVDMVCITPNPNSSPGRIVSVETRETETDTAGPDGRRGTRLSIPPIPCRSADQAPPHAIGLLSHANPLNFKLKIKLTASLLIPPDTRKKD
jgi:hypothetical protein